MSTLAPTHGEVEVQTDWTGPIDRVRCKQLKTTGRRLAAAAIATSAKKERSKNQLSSHWQSSSSSSADYSLVDGSCNNDKHHQTSSKAMEVTSKQPPRSSTSGTKDSREQVRTTHNSINESSGGSKNPDAIAMSSETTVFGETPPFIVDKHSPQTSVAATVANSLDSHLLINNEINDSLADNISDQKSSKIPSDLPKRQKRFGIKTKLPRLNKKRPPPIQPEEQEDHPSSQPSDSRKKSNASYNETEEENDHSEVEQKPEKKAKRGKLKKRGIRDLSTDEKWAVYTGYDDLQSYRGVGRMFNMDHSTVKLLIARINAEQPDQVMTKELFLQGFMCLPAPEPKVTKKLQKELQRAAKLEERHSNGRVKKNSFKDNIFMPSNGSSPHRLGDDAQGDDDQELALDRLGEDEERDQDEDEYLDGQVQFQGRLGDSRSKKGRRKYNLTSSTLQNLTEGSGYPPYHHYHSYRNNENIGSDDILADTNNNIYPHLMKDSIVKEKKSKQGKGQDDSSKQNKKKSKKQLLQESLIFGEGYNNQEQTANPNDEVVYLPEYDQPQQNNQMLPYSHDYHISDPHAENYPQNAYQQIGLPQQTLSFSQTSPNLGLQSTGLSQDINSLPFEGQLQLITMQENAFMMYGNNNNNNTYNASGYAHLDGQSNIQQYGQQTQQQQSNNYEINYEVDLADIQGTINNKKNYQTGTSSNQNEDEIKLEII